MWRQYFKGYGLGYKWLETFVNDALKKKINQHRLYFRQRLEFTHINLGKRQWKEGYCIWGRHPHVLASSHKNSCVACRSLWMTLLMHNWHYTETIIWTSQGFKPLLDLRPIVVLFKLWCTWHSTSLSVTSQRTRLSVKLI